MTAKKSGSGSRARSHERTSRMVAAALTGRNTRPVRPHPVTSFTHAGSRVVIERYGRDAVTCYSVRK